MKKNILTKKFKFKKSDVQGSYQKLSIPVLYYYELLYFKSHRLYLSTEVQAWLYIMLLLVCTVVTDMWMLYNYDILSYSAFTHGFDFFSEIKEYVIWISRLRKKKS